MRRYVMVKTFLGIFLFLGLNCSQTSAEINNFYELKKALQAPGEAEIQLENDIVVTETIYVNGKKKLNGNGHVIKRTKKTEEGYKGTLLIVKNAKLELFKVKISGEDEKVVSDCTGRLIDVEQGEIVLETETELIKNQNVSSNSDGGGAVLVRDGGKLTMNAGKIMNNRNVAGGAAVRVESGGCFSMLGGTIANNEVHGIGQVEGFDGRGGAICNYGKVMIANGKISGNQVKAFVQKNTSYGGVGGAIYNQGECRILGGIITRNVASFGGGAVYTDEDAYLEIMGGTIKVNYASSEKNIFLAGGTWKIFEKKKVSETLKKEIPKKVRKKTKTQKKDIKPRKNEAQKKSVSKTQKTEKSEKKSSLVKVEQEPVEKVEKKEKKEGYLRFVQSSKEDAKIQEIWHFESEKLKEIKTYMKNRKNPFSKDTNQEFLKRFLNCMKKGGM